MQYEKTACIINADAHLALLYFKYFRIDEAYPHFHHFTYSFYFSPDSIFIFE